jgi:hypothetical protein
LGRVRTLSGSRCPTQRGVLMRHAALLLLMVILLVTGVVAQSPGSNRRAEIAAAVERRLQSQQPVELSADSITLTGKLLSLKGHVRVVWLPDTVIRAEEVRISEGTVELIGDVNASFGRSSGVPLPRPPQIEFR